MERKTGKTDEVMEVLMRAAKCAVIAALVFAVMTTILSVVDYHSIKAEAGETETESEESAERGYCEVLGKDGEYLPAAAVSTSDGGTMILAAGETNESATVVFQEGEGESAAEGTAVFRQSGWTVLKTDAKPETTAEIWPRRLNKGETLTMVSSAGVSQAEATGENTAVVSGPRPSVVYTEGGDVVGLVIAEGIQNGEGKTGKAEVIVQNIPTAVFQYRYS